MSYRPPIVQSPYPGMTIQQPVVVSGMPYQQAYYPNYPNQTPQNVKIVNQPNIVKNTNPTATDYHIDYFIRNQMNSLKKLIEHAENIKNSRENFSSPFESRWRCVTNPFPSFWKFENDQIFNLSENLPTEFSVPNDQNLSMNYQKINEPRIQPNITSIPTNSTSSLASNPAYNSNVLPPPRSQSPQVSVVATNFIPQRQPSPEIVVNGIPSKNIMTNPTNYNNGIPPNNIIISNNNNMARNVNEYDVNISNPMNPVGMNNMQPNNYSNPLNPVTINNSAPNSAYNYPTSINNAPYNNPNAYVPNANYNDPNNYNNGAYNNTGYNNYNGYNNTNANTNNSMYNNKGNYPSYNNNPNSNIGYRKQGYKPNGASNPPNSYINNNKKHNPRKRSRGGSQWTYKPGDQE